MVGPDRVQLPPTSPLALSFPVEEREREREREREPGIRKFFLVSTTPHERSSAKVSWRSAKIIIFNYVSLVVLL